MGQLLETGVNLVSFFVPAREGGSSSAHDGVSKNIKVVPPVPCLSHTLNAKKIPKSLYILSLWDNGTNGTRIL